MAGASRESLPSSCSIVLRNKFSVFLWHRFGRGGSELFGHQAPGGLGTDAYLHAQARQRFPPGAARFCRVRHFPIFRPPPTRRGGEGRSCLDPRFPELSYRPKRRRLSVLSVFIANQGDFCVPCAVLCPFRAPGVPEQNQRRRRLAHQERRLCPTSVQRRTD